MKEIDRHYLFDLSPQNQNEKRGKWIIRFLLSYQLFNLRNPIIVIYDKILPVLLVAMLLLSVWTTR